MAAATLTIRAGAVKAPFTALSPYARHFIVLLDALAFHIHAERLFDRTGLSDTVYADRLEAVDAARGDLHDVLLRNLEMPAAAASDAPLRRMTLLIATLIREDRASAFARYAELRQDLAPFLQVSGDGPVAARLRHMLAAAETRITLMAGLSCYRQEGALLEAEPARIAA